MSLTSHCSIWFLLIKSISKFWYEKCDRHVRSKCDVQRSRLIYYKKTSMGIVFFDKMWIMPCLLIFLYCSLRIIIICTLKGRRYEGGTGSPCNHLSHSKKAKLAFEAVLAWPRFSKVRLIFLFEVHSEI